MTTTLDTVLGPRVTPDATLVLPVDAPRETWLAERRKGIGGSDASTIVGVNRFGSRYGLWLDKTGIQIPTDKPTDEMEFGKRSEQMIADWFTDQTGITTTRVGLLRSKERPWQLASPDRLTDDGGVLECKSTGWRMAEEWDDDQVADHAEVQLAHYLAVTGRSHGWAAVLIDRSLRVRRVERDDDLIHDITVMEQEFWEDHVLTGVEPRPISAGDLVAIKDRFSSVITEQIEVPADDVLPLLSRWLDAKAAVKAAEKDADTAEAGLRELIGDAEQVLVNGAPVLTCKANGTFSDSKFRAAHPHLAEQYLRSRHVVDTDRLKADEPELYTAYRARVMRAVKGA